MCDSDVYSREIISIFVSVKCLRLLKTNIGIYSDTINAINFKLCMVILLIEIYLFIPLSVTLTVFQSHSSVEQF